MADSLNRLVHELFVPVLELVDQLAIASTEQEAIQLFRGDHNGHWRRARSVVSKLDLENLPGRDLREAVDVIAKIAKGAKTQCNSYPDVAIYIYKRLAPLRKAAQLGWTAAKQGGDVPDDPFPIEPPTHETNDGRDLTVPTVKWDKETRDAFREGKTVDGLPLGELIPIDDLRLAWKGRWPDDDPRTPEGLIAYVKERLQYARLCERSQRQYDEATQVDSVGSTPISREWPHDSPIEVVREAMDNIRLLLDHTDIDERPSFLTSPADFDDGIAKLSATLAWLKRRCRANEKGKGPTSEAALENLTEGESTSGTSVEEMNPQNIRDDVCKVERVDNHCDTMPHKLLIDQWQDLGIGIDEAGRYLAVTPCPDHGQVFPKESAIPLELPGDQWANLFDILAESEDGMTAPKSEAMSRFGYCRRVPPEELKDVDPDTMSIIKNANNQVAKAIRDLNKRLRKEVRCNCDGRQSPPLSAKDEYKIESLFTVRRLFRDHDGMLKFGKAG